ncbi:MAG: hypothetical protein ACE5FQ_08295 [Thiogranum sp.]
MNEVVQHLHMAEKGNYKFTIDWSDSCYRNPGSTEDPWNYYFHDCFPDTAEKERPLQLLPNGLPVACAKDNIITPRLVDGNCVPLLLPKNRDLPHRLITQYIHLKPHIQKIINNFVGEHFSGHVIGLHIRGPGRIDGGAPGLRSRFPCRNGVPFGQYMKFVDSQLLTTYPHARIFASSDSSFVIREITRHYGEKIITYPSTRSEFGEMHNPAHPANRGATFPKYKLGEDVLAEAYIFSRTNHFIHGNSNIVNYVLCLNPALSHKYVY